jgi:RNA polymerase sigma factor (sigma-70 family)
MLYGQRRITYHYHASFNDQTYQPPADSDTEERGYFSQEDTVAWSRAMHSAAHRVHQLLQAKQLVVPHIERMLAAYDVRRNAIVTGNQKLAYRAARRAAGGEYDLSAELAADAFPTLVIATQEYNPWLNIRFSTYATTCLTRFFQRELQLRQKRTDRPVGGSDVEDVFWRDDAEPYANIALSHDLEQALRSPLITTQERGIIDALFFPDAGAKTTLEAIGKAIGLSKERVRQIKNRALFKLRLLLTGEEIRLEDV